MLTATQNSVKSLLSSMLILAAGALTLSAATLEKLTLDQMIIRSTAIVRGKVLNSYTTTEGPVIYTHYRIQVSETYKGPARATVEIGYPGGISNNQRQSFAGVPQFSAGDEYVFFLWAGKSGMLQTVGLTQGLFSLPKGPVADPLTMRPASSEVMLDHTTGKYVKDQTLTMPLSELRARIKYIMSGASN